MSGDVQSFKNVWKDHWGIPTKEQVKEDLSGLQEQHDIPAEMINAWNTSHYPLIHSLTQGPLDSWITRGTSLDQLALALEDECETPCIFSVSRKRKRSPECSEYDPCETPWRPPPL